MKKIFLLLFIISNSLLAQNISLYVGTYTHTESKGIYTYNFNTKTGKLTNKQLVATVEHPSFLAFSSNKKYLYAVSEVHNFDANNSGFVSAYSVDKKGSLQFINKVSTNGADPCNVFINKKNSKLAVSNYGGGNVSLYKVEKNGKIQPANQVINLNKGLKIAHAHSAKFYKNNLFISDLGNNKFLQYIKTSERKYKVKSNYLIENNGGPRHFEISKRGKFIYVINELSSTITVLKKRDNDYFKVQNISTLDDNFKGKSFCADIHLSKNRKYLYGSNRGENTIVVFKINSKTGTLQKIQSISVNGNWPRNFTISPKGKFLLVANQKSNNISVYKIDKPTGKLSFLYSTTIAIPVCLLF